MNIAKLVRKIFTLDKRTTLLIIEAYIYLGWARLLLFLPFIRVAPILGSQMRETSYNTVSENKPVLKEVCRAIRIVSRYTFWESRCFVKAIAGLKMLERRNIESTLYLGTAKDHDAKLIAHAWLRSGSEYITGADEMKKFAVVGKFAKCLSDS
ncbi:MAG: lasso peptide biosynthesis B2 protein [Thermincola sp.]|jgi:hypothetical protein|nr:lasso peptide biosynthesis B2 protein [Thermincola sp.]MDT3704279.1 lasso peptide biosynthesis B2 protein [Thermincola sp.]